MQHPLFGPLAWDPVLDRWRGRIRLDIFADYAERAFIRAEALAGRVDDTSRQPKCESDVELELINSAWEEPLYPPFRRRFSRFLRMFQPGWSRPTERQEQAFRQFLQRRDEICNRVVDALYDHYRSSWGDWRDPAEPGTKGPYYDELLIPEPSSRATLKEVIALNHLSVIDDRRIDLSVLGFCFSCTWDSEHGLGVLVRDAEVIEIGENDLTWRYPPSSGEYRPKPPSEAEAAEQFGIAAVSRLGGKTWQESDERIIDLRANDRIEDSDLLLLGRFPTVHQLSVASSLITDRAIETVKTSSELHTFELHGAGISDAGLTQLSGLRNLRRLDLSRTRITDNGLTLLRGLEQLKKLDLTDTGVTDAGLDNLNDLPMLNTLHLGGTGITDIGVQSLAALARLRTLDLSRTAVTNSGISALREQQSLISLDLAATAVTDAALAILKEIPNLRYLTLSHCKITEQGLEHLKELKSLRSLKIESLAFPESAISNLKQAIPGLQVVQ
jgi:Leucine-rich repeat (LRR) protein